MIGTCRKCGALIHSDLAGIGAAQAQALLTATATHLQQHHPQKFQEIQRVCEFLFLTLAGDEVETNDVPNWRGYGLARRLATMSTLGIQATAAVTNPGQATNGRPAEPPEEPPKTS